MRRTTVPSGCTTNAFLPLPASSRSRVCTPPPHRLGGVLLSLLLLRGGVELSRRLLGGDLDGDPLRLLGGDGRSSRGRGARRGGGDRPSRPAGSGARRGGGGESSEYLRRAAGGEALRRGEGSRLRGGGDLESGLSRLVERGGGDRLLGDGDGDLDSLVYRLLLRGGDLESLLALGLLLRPSSESESDSESDELKSELDRSLDESLSELSSAAFIAAC